MPASQPLLLQSLLLLLAFAPELLCFAVAFCKSFYTLPLDIRAVEGGELQNVTFWVRFYTPTPSTGSVGHVDLQNELQIGEFAPTNSNIRLRVARIVIIMGFLQFAFHANHRSGVCRGDCCGR